MVFTGGLRITTTVDLATQAAGAGAVVDHLAEHVGGDRGQPRRPG
jgi:hypothetical protein